MDPFEKANEVIMELVKPLFAILGGSIFILFSIIVILVLIKKKNNHIS